MMGGRARVGNRRIAIAVALVVCVAGTFALPATPRSRASAPVITQWSLGPGNADCNCLAISLVMTSDAPTVIRVEWGTTPALGSVAGSGPTPIGVGVNFSVDWVPRPAPGSYYERIIAENSAGSTATPTTAFTVGVDGSVSVAPPTFPPPTTSRPGFPRATVTVASTAPITVAVGDTFDIQATVTTNSWWLFTPPMATTLSVTVLGPVTTCFGCALSGVDVVSAAPTSGSCTSQLSCNFGPVGPNSASSVVIRLRGKTPGTYQLAVGSSIEIPLTVVPRVADLGVTPLLPVQRLRVGKTISRTVTIQNNGPNGVSDATLIVGEPRGVSVRATSADGTCTLFPVRCAIKALSMGQTATVRLTIVADRAGRISIPIGVASREAGDSQTSNNAFRFLLNTVSPKPKPQPHN